MLLQIKDLMVSYQAGTPVLKNVSFSLDQGQVLAVAGESGSGKSTLAKVILGVLPQSAKLTGQVLFQGANLLELSLPRLNLVRGKDLGLIMQDPVSSFNPVWTLKWQFEEILRLKLGLKNKKEISQVVAENLDLVHLPDGLKLINSYPHQLSGGQLQRIAIAMAISLSPKLLIADEPTGSLDICSESRIINLLANISRKTNMAVLLITHNLELVKVVSQKTLILKDGAVCAYDDTEKIFQQPKDQYTRSLVAALEGMGGG